LDLGSGDGTLLCLLERHYGMPDAVGIDISAQNVARGNDVAGYVRKAGDARTNVRLYAGDIATVHLPLHRDLVTAFDTLSFTKSPHASLLRVCSVALRLAGCVIVTDYVWLQKAYAVDADARPLFPSKDRSEFEKAMEFTGHGLPTVDGWRACIEQAGLSIVRDSNTSAALKTRMSAIVASDPTNSKSLATLDMAEKGYLGHWTFVATKINNGDPSPYSHGKSASPTEGCQSKAPQSPELKAVRSVRNANDRYAALRKK
jgi:SAM-dependent methyltransferase